MQFRRFVLSVSFLAVLGGLSSSAQADGRKISYFGWWPSHWENLTWTPYLEDAIHPQVNQWNGKHWVVADWVAQRPAGGEKDIIDGFYRADILSDQYVENDLPVLVVGPNFYQLSGYDKRRVVQTVDDYFKITGSHAGAMFTLLDWKTEDPIGLYTASGLILQ